MDLFTVTFTAQQHEMFQQMWNEAQERDLRIADWTGESEGEIASRYQLPADALLDDMAEHAAGLAIGFSLV